MKRNRIITIFLTLALLFTMLPLSNTTVQAATKEELERQRQELQQQLLDITRRLADIKDEAEKARERAKTYAERKAIVENQILLLQQSIDLVTTELRDKQEELDKKEAERKETQELFRQRIRAMYMSNNASTLSTLLGATSLTDFLMQAEMMRRISEHDTDLVEKLAQETVEIEAAKADIQVALDALEADKAELDKKYDELAALYQEANADISRAEAKQEATEEDYKKILEERDRVNREWDELMGTGEGDSIGEGTYRWPVPGFSYISSGYGWRILYGVQNWHAGIDIAGAGIYGQPIIASDSGKVVVSKYQTTGYGYHVMIDHGANNWTVYGHMSSIAAQVGQYVNKGDIIGYVGSTGNSTGPHLHFEIRLNGSTVNPANYVSYGY